MKKYERWSPGSVLATRRILRLLQVRRPRMMTFSAQRSLPANNNICLKLLRMLHCCATLPDYLPLFLDQSKAAKRLSRLRIYFFVFLCDHLLICRRNLIFFLWTNWLYSLMLLLLCFFHHLDLFSFCEFAYSPDFSLHASCIFQQRRFIVTFKSGVWINFYFIFNPDIYPKFAHRRRHTNTRACLHARAHIHANTHAHIYIYLCVIKI